MFDTERLFNSLRYDYPNIESATYVTTGFMGGNRYFVYSRALSVIWAEGTKLLEVAASERSQGLDIILFFSRVVWAHFHVPTRNECTVSFLRANFSGSRVLCNFTRGQIKHFAHPTKLMYKVKNAKR